MTRAGSAADCFLIEHKCSSRRAGWMHSQHFVSHVACGVKTTALRHHQEVQKSKQRLFPLSLSLSLSLSHTHIHTLSMTDQPTRPACTK